MLRGRLQTAFVIFLAVVRGARLFARQFPAPAAGAPGEAERCVEEGFEGWDAGGYDADCFFETVEGLVEADSWGLG